ncbi:hypothetical protein Y1Q_0020295 [Alligator mississippiensis]|uniref:Lipid-binding serum glycoprotein C-terminal domain-containing protein n=1 Tax=Alligator mississippiensis TaxID=8496 RepID=A0A151MI28_ALLMI|nr:hypothetical protein Y1Q_0020295 [Alligator mississippiensis]
MSKLLYVKDEDGKRKEMLNNHRNGRLLGLKMLRVLGLVLCGLLMPSEGLRVGSTIIPQSSYARACEESMSGLFESESRNITFPGLKFTSVFIKDLHVATIIIYPVKILCVPGVGVKVIFTAKLHVLGTCTSNILPGMVTISLKVRCIALVLLPQFSPLSNTIPINSSKCAVAFLNVTSSLPDVNAGVIASLQNSVTFEIQTKISKIFFRCLSLGHAKMLDDLMSALPVEKGKIRYVIQPLKVHNRTIEVPVLTEYETDSGEKILIPPEPDDDIKLPEYHETSEAIGQNVLTFILSRIVLPASLSIPCTPATFYETTTLENIITDLIVSKCSTCPVIYNSLIINMKVLKPLEVYLDVDVCNMNISLTLEIVTKHGNGSLIPLIKLEVRLALTAVLQVFSGKVWFITTLDRLHIRWISSIVGRVNVERLYPTLKVFILKIVIKLINFNLQKGKFPLHKWPGLKPKAAKCRFAKRCIVCYNHGKKG